MIRNMLIATALALPAVPALAQTAVPAGPGALAGRSPQQAYRTTAATQSCGHAMHSLPAGKLPTYGTHALTAKPCDGRQLASADDRPRESAKD